MAVDMSSANKVRLHYTYTLPDSIDSGWPRHLKSKATHSLLRPALPHIIHIIYTHPPPHYRTRLLYNPLSSIFLHIRKVDGRSGRTHSPRDWRFIHSASREPGFPFAEYTVLDDANLTFSCGGREEYGVRGRLVESYIMVASCKVQEQDGAEDARDYRVSLIEEPSY